MDSPTVGILGLGGLGLPVAANIAKSMPVIGYDPKQPAGETVHDARTVATVDEVAAGASTILLCLPSPKVSAAVVTALAALPADQPRLIVELSTIGIETAEACAAIAAEAGVGYLDAPVSGLVAKAWAGTLTVMAAGRAEYLATAQPILELISSHIFALGDRPGLGQAMKLANNIINATSFAITSEAIVFGTRAGLDLAQMLDILNVSTGMTSASLEKFPQGVLNRTAVPGAPGEIIAKDVALFLAEAAQVGTPVAVSTVVGQLWAEYVSRHPNTDSIELYGYLNGGINK